MSFLNTKRLTFFVAILFLATCAPLARAATVGETVTFNIDDRFDVTERPQVKAVLVKSENNLHFYIEKSWWETQVFARQNEIVGYLGALSNEFDTKIYPKLTSVFGSEWNPGVDGDRKITILFHPMKEGIGGYFRSADERIKLQLPESNGREMIYLPVEQIDNFPTLKVFLAHEFVHLITYNQKERLQGVREEVWLNEARADFASTILGYDDIYEGSNLEQRVVDFLQNPSDPLTEWKDNKYDYAAVNVFMHYVADHYSNQVLYDSLKLRSVGIESLNEALAKEGVKENFNQVFTNWTVTLMLNDCVVSTKYCYINQNLKSLRISPTLNFLPLSGNSSLSVNNVTKNWSGNWQKIIGGNGDLKLQLESLPGLTFNVPYIIFDKQGGYSVKFFALNADGKGEINIKDFGNIVNSLVIIPSLQNKTSGFNGFEFTYPYTFTVTTSSLASQDDSLIIQRLLAQIEDLKRQIAQIQNQGDQNAYCSKINNDLYIGIQNSNEVRCLQQFLKVQSLYPEGIISGYFGSLTRAAVLRFQQKYKILTTGYVGPLTRAKINQLLGAQ